MLSVNKKVGNMLDSIVDTARESNKICLIMGSARSRTHALGAALATRLPSFDLELIFSNLDFVKKQLGEWHYSKGHYGDQ
jgi:hypothetical protein